MSVLCVLIVGVCLIPSVLSVGTMVTQSVALFRAGREYHVLVCESERLEKARTSITPDTVTLDIRDAIKKACVRNECLLIHEVVEREKNMPGADMPEAVVQYQLEGTYGHIVRCVLEMLSLHAPVFFEALKFEPAGNGRGTRMSCRIRLIDERR